MTSTPKLDAMGGSETVARQATLQQHRTKELAPQLGRLTGGLVDIDQHDPAPAGQHERRPIVAIAILVASSLTVLGHVQWDNCSGFSKQISRELDAILMFPLLLAATAGIASLGRLTAGIVHNRRSHQSLDAPIA